MVYIEPKIAARSMKRLLCPSCWENHKAIVLGTEEHTRACPFCGALYRYEYEVIDSREKQDYLERLELTRIQGREPPA